mgnify:CR=1 FL=1
MTDFAFERVLDSLKLKNLKDSHQDLVKGQDVLIIQPTGSGNILYYKQGQRLTHPAFSSEKIKDRIRETAEMEHT